MANKNTFICSECGSKITDYKHIMTYRLVEGLYKLHKAGGLATTQSLGMEYSPRANFQKLQYFGLVVRTGKKYQWQITTKGVEFLQCRTQVPHWIITRKKKIMFRSDELIFINQVNDCVQYKIEWQEQAGQPTLFD